jgi:hypothetical protein
MDKYRKWQERCIDECNRIYGTDFRYSMLDNSNKKFGKTFEICEDGEIHFGNWYQDLPKWEGVF